MYTFVAIALLALFNNFLFPYLFCYVLPIRVTKSSSSARTKGQTGGIPSAASSKPTFVVLGNNGVDLYDDIVDVFNDHS
jgi:hypothetical protein